MNIVDLLCERLGLHGTGKYSELGKRFGESRQTINGWKTRNKIPPEHFRRALALGLELDQILPPMPDALPVPMREFILDPTRYLEAARTGAEVHVTVNGSAVLRIGAL